MPSGTLINANDIHTYNWTQPIAYKSGSYHYIAGVQFGGANPGAWRVFKTNGTTTTVTSMYATPEDDDHNHPSLAWQAGKDTVGIFQRHGESVKINKCRAAENTISFGSKTDTSFANNVTYSGLLWELGTNNLFVFTRSPSYKWAFKKSTDWGVSFGSEQVFVDNGSGNKTYCTFNRSESNEDIYHVAMYGHPDESSLTDIYYCNVNVSTGDISNSSGVIANLDGTNLPLSYSDFDVAWTPAGTTNPRVRLLDISEKRGNIVVAYAKWSDTDETNPNYLYSWSDDGGATWNAEFIADSGGIFGSTLARKYVGGISFDRNSRNEFYVSRKDSGTWKIQRYVINTDMTCSYDSTRDTSSVPLVRPVCPVNGDGVFYCQLIDYTTYLDWESKLYWRT